MADKCPRCGKGRIIIDTKTGENVCNNCGYVLPVKAIDTGPDWRAFTQEERKDRKRTGPPTSLTKVGKGLATVIGKDIKDAHGKKLTALARSRFRRMRTWDVRSKLYTPKQRNLLKATNFLSRLADKLQVPIAVQEEAAYIYRKALNNKLIKGRSITGMVAASLYAACRNNRVPRTLKDITRASNVNKNEITRSYRVLLQMLGMKMPVMDPSRRVARIAKKVGVKEKTQRVALKILDQAKKEGITVGKNPMGIAAAALYVASILETEDVTQDQLADAAGITSVTLRKRYADLKRLKIK
ncbi:MAG: transcription initiation factor IIB family protein [Nitrososphaerales archaeon]